MNKVLYNTLFLFFIGSFGLMAQSQKKYQKTFSVNKNTSLLFQTMNIDVTFKLWDKDEVKIDFNVDFKNYSEEEINTIYKEIAVECNMKSTMRDTNYLQIQNTSPRSIGRLSYQINSGEIHIEDMFTEKNEPNQYKTVKDINKEISEGSNGFEDLDGYVVFKNDSVALKNIRNSTRKEIKSISASYEIYIPKYMKLGLSVYNANINFEGTFTSQISGVFQESKIQASELLNRKNVLTLINGSIKVKKVVGGNYTFKNVSESLIGQLENVKMQTEFSKFKLGEITKDLELKDFKSDFLIYNLGDNFNRINMFCEYSNIKMYTIKDQKYYMEAVGNNAVLNDNGTKIIMQPNRDGQKLKMFSRGEDTPETRKNTFKLDLIHGFVTLLYNK